MRLVVGITAVVAALTACGNPYAILPATIPNLVDTVEVFAVNGTGLNKPSGYVLSSRFPVRLGIDVTSYNFDFLYRIDPNTGPEFVPYRVVAPGAPGSSTLGYPGLQPATTAFDAIREAQQVGYVVDRPTPIQVGQVLFARSGLPNGCFLNIPYYAKLEVLSFDEAARSVRFRVLVNINCGYRQLEPGIPSQ
ncbi:MAG: hypothetical protein ACYC2K_14060 [Gemmatimonadales bacterium]